MKKLFTLYLAVSTITNVLAEGWERVVFSVTPDGVYFATAKQSKPTASKELNPRNLFDRNPVTAWTIPSSGSKTSGSISVATGNHLPAYLAIANGIQKNRETFQQYNRIRTLTVTLYVAVTSATELADSGCRASAAAYPVSKKLELIDTMGYQIVKLPFNTNRLSRFRDSILQEYLLTHKTDLYREKAYSWIRGFFYLKFEITDIYKGSEQNLTGLSDILFSNRNSLPFIPLNETVIAVTESDNEGAILARSATGKTYALKRISRRELLNGTTLGVSAISPDKQWAVIRLTKDLGKGEITNRYRLYYIPLLQEINSDNLYYMGSPLGFTTKGKELYIRFARGIVPATEVKADMLYQKNELICFTSYPFQALSILFAEAIRMHNSEQTIACLDENYLYETLFTRYKNDTATFLNRLLSNATRSSHNIRFEQFTLAGKPSILPADSTTLQIRIPISNGTTTTTCRWTIIENEGEGPLPVLGLIPNTSR